MPKSRTASTASARALSRKPLEKQLAIPISEKGQRGRAVPTTMIELFLGPTWFRRGCGFGTGHVEGQAPRKSIWKQSNCKRRIVRTRRLIPVSLSTVGLWAGLESQDKG
jgi:hypothetical protein